MTRVAIIGGGVVGAAIAYELSAIAGLNITLFDRETPASGSTGAALGVLMGAISHKTKGRGWRLRQTSLERYETLIPELEALTGVHIPFNRHGLLRLRWEGEAIAPWERLVELRRRQGWPLEIWDRAMLREKCPHLQSDRIIGAIYSPQDRQVHPAKLTEALVAGARLNGVECQFGTTVEGVMATPPDRDGMSRGCELQTPQGSFAFDRLAIAAGLGSTPLTKALAQPVDLRPVLGQALQIELPQPLGEPDFQPVVTGSDVHLVPLGGGGYWIGATVEFPNDEGEVTANPTLLEQVKKQASAFCPALTQGTVVQTWLGLRPRPEGRPAPIIERLSGYRNIFLATGHYRNGVLLAPATALTLQEAIVQSAPQAR